VWQIVPKTGFQKFGPACRKPAPCGPQAQEKKAPNTLDIINMLFIPESRQLTNTLSFLINNPMVIESFFM